MPPQIPKKSIAKLAKLRDTVAGVRSLLIVMQDHPDPDAIASAVALRRVVNTWNVSCSIVCSGMMGRAENRALIQYLDLNLRSPADIKAESFGMVALVDTQPGTGNNSLPPDIAAEIVIDHHPVRRITRSAAFTDVRSDYGATSTILCEYLLAAEVAIDPPLATSLLYGIRSDTLDLARGARKPDLEMHHYLYGLANLRMLARIQQSELPEGYYRSLYRAIGQAWRFGHCIFSEVGTVSNPDMAGEIADLLVRFADIRWCLCVARFQDTLLLSLRAQGTEKDAGEVMRRIIGRRGTGGGHSLYAGGQVPLSNPAEEERSRETIDWLFERFRTVLRSKGKTPQRLIA